MSPPVSSGEERGLLSRTAAGNRAYLASELLKNSSFSSPITIENIVIFLIMSKNRVNFSWVYLSDRCCIWENVCGVRLTNFLPICYSIQRLRVGPRSEKLWTRAWKSCWYSLYRPTSRLITYIYLHPFCTRNPCNCIFHFLCPLTANAGSIRIPIGGQLIYDTMSKTADLCLSPHMCPPCVLDALCQQDNKPNLGTTAATYSTEVSSSSTSSSPTATSFSTEITSTASAPTTETSVPTEESTRSTAAPTSPSSTTEQTQPSASQVTSATEITEVTESTYTASTYPTIATTVGGGMEPERGEMFLVGNLFIGRLIIFSITSWVLSDAFVKIPYMLK